MITKTPPEIRFWRKVDKRGPDECWPWIGERTTREYGRFTPHPKRRDKNGYRPPPKMAHRMAWTYSFGPIPEGHEVCHTCDNPPCCNPSHLFTGTHKQNMEDMSKKGRAVPQRGELHKLHKLTDRRVAEARAMYRPGVVSHAMIARLFGVSKQTITKALNGKSWKHVQ